MAVLTSEIKRVAATTVAADFSTSSVGGALTTTVLSGNSVGETLFEMPSTADGSGDGDRVQYGKEGIANTNGTDSFASGKLWLANGIDEWGVGMDTVVLTSDSATDNSDLYAKVIGYDTSGDPVTLTVPLNGTSNAATVDQLTYLARVTLHYASGPNEDLPAPATGTITVARGNATVLGVIPAGFYSATQELDIGLAATINDTVTIADASTAPAGITFSRPRTSAAGIAFAATLTGGAKQGVWLRWTVREGIKPSADWEYVFGIAGEAT